MIYCQFLASLWLTSCNTYISTCNNLYVILSFWTNLLQAKNRWHQWWLLHENFASICHVLPLKSEFFSPFWSRKHSRGPRNLVDDGLTFLQTIFWSLNEVMQWNDRIGSGLMTMMSFWVSSALDCSLYRWRLFLCVYFTFPWIGLDWRILLTIQVEENVK